MAMDILPVTEEEAEVDSPDAAAPGKAFDMSRGRGGPKMETISSPLPAGGTVGFLIGVCLFCCNLSASKSILEVFLDGEDGEGLGGCTVVAVGVVGSAFDGNGILGRASPSFDNFSVSLSFLLSSGLEAGGTGACSTVVALEVVAELESHFDVAATFFSALLSHGLASPPTVTDFSISFSLPIFLFSETLLLVSPTVFAS